MALLSSAMDADAINIMRCLSDGRWRTATDVSVKTGVLTIRAQETLERLAREGRLHRDRPCGVSIYCTTGGGIETLKPDCPGNPTAPCVRNITPENRGWGLTPTLRNEHDSETTQIFKDIRGTR